MKQPWFSNKGQAIQIGLQILTILIGLKLWPEMSANRMLTPGALLFYLFMGMAIAATVINIVFTRRSSSPHVQPVPEVPPSRTPPGLMILRRLWVAWSALGDMYERLDYDNRSNTATRLPFNSASWPDYGQPWSYVHAQLYKYSALSDFLRQATEALMLPLGLEVSALPRTGETVVMVDFLREVREFQAYLDSKISNT